MHWLDLAIIAVIAWNAFAAFRTGLIRELVNLVGVVLGAILAGQLYDNLSANMSFAIGHDATRNLVAFGAIFAGINIVAQVASSMLASAAKMLMLGPLDHLGGAVFGFLKGALLVEVVLIAAQTFPVAEGLTKALEESTLAPVFLQAVPVMEALLPGEFKDALEQFKNAPSIPSLPLHP